MSKQNGNLPQTKSKLSLLACLTAITIGISGCGKTDSPADSKTNSETSQTEEALQDQVATISLQQKLTGVWLGAAQLDQAPLQDALNQMPPAERAVTLTKARSFLSTVIAIDFRKDGTVENEMEIVSTNGQVLRDGATGTWSVIESTSEGILVETVEKLSDGTTSKSQTRYRFLTNDNEFAMPVEVGQDLAQFNARIVFQRQSLPATNIAENPSGTQTK